MARKQRIEYPGALYHVIQRGNNQEHIFERPEYKDKVIEQLRKMVLVDGIELFAYVIMSNHYHLALRTNTEPLSRVMHRINTVYSMYYNRTGKRSGHVFQGRYQAIPVHDEKYLLSLITYIHRNPVRAGIADNVADYPWSSDRHYRQMEPGFVAFEFVLDQLSNSRKNSLREYNLLMKQNVDLDLDLPDVTEVIAPAADWSEKPAPDRRSLKDVLMAVINDQEEYELIRKGSRIRKLMSSKEQFAKTALEHGYSMQEIARYIGVSPVAVCKYINKQD
ncbi:MAG: transposase [Desulfotomaculaceae bacterium]